MNVFSKYIVKVLDCDYIICKSKFSYDSNFICFADIFG